MRRAGPRRGLTEPRSNPRLGTDSIRKPGSIPSKRRRLGMAPQRLPRQGSDARLPRFRPGSCRERAGHSQCQPTGLSDMRIKRFTAPDMRTALRMVRDEQGPDAVILSTRTSAGGVGIEVVAATDYDEALVA